MFYYVLAKSNLQDRITYRNKADLRQSVEQYETEVTIQNERQNSSFEVTLA